MNIQLSPHFSLAEATFSSTADRLGIDNSSPSQAVINAAIHTATRLEIVRQCLGTPIHIDSFIRCLALNKSLGSKDTSQHVIGEAVDFTAPEYGTPFDICKKIVTSLVDFDQLILEHSWVHISFKFNPSIHANRKQVISLLATGGYASGLTDKYGKVL
jgi:zinc D-Ala-D-Ala carboxypeptidase